ncbi:MAG: FAD-dependent oxidoreductase [Spirochaetaceae bacterium]|nr:FAD-dependent oxidoreductase [Spirochaetaceae bacterium]
MKKSSRTFVAGILALSLAACQTGGGGGKYAAGEYRASREGFGGPVEVALTVEGGKIAKVEIKGAGETPFVGGAAMEKIKENILKTGKAEVDIVTGATRTSTAVKEALAAALARPAESAAPARLPKDGKYLTKAMGHEGEIFVTTMFRNGAIASAVVTAHEETMGIGNFATARLPDRIVKAQSIAVESVSGATVSSGAVKAAVAQAIKNAGGDVAAFQKPVKKEVIKQEVSERVDVVIVGAGTAGLVAGARLAEQGKKVILFEKMDIPGGSMATTYSGVMNSHSELGAAYGLGREKQSPSWNKKALMAVFKNYIHAEYDRFNGEQPYQNAMMDASGKLVDWMHKIGVGFASMGYFEGGLQYGLTPYLAPGCYQGGAGYALMFLADRINTLGTRIVYGTPVTSLRTDASGRVVGVRAEGKDGKVWDVTADAVVLATGGFASNPEMVAQYYPANKDHRFNAVAASTGEGIVMGQAVGAAVECMGRELGAFMSAYGSDYELAFMHVSTPGIMVNVDGRQFGNIAVSNHKTLAKALLDPANKKTFYYVFDDSGAEATKDFDAYGLSYKPIFDRGEALRYDSVAAAAKALNLPELAATLEKHNQLALAGQKDEFGRGKLPYIETRDGLWLLRVIPTFYLTTGGLAIDTKARVLDKNGAAIKGLYAAGDVTGSIEEKDGKEYGNGFDAAMTYGYIAADTIVAEAK